MKVSVGQSIKLYRIKRGMTQAGVAESIGVTPQTISRWEAGISYPALEYLPDMAVLFGVTVDNLLGITANTHELKRDRLYSLISYLEQFGYRPYAINLLAEGYFSEFRDDMNIGLSLAKALCYGMWDEKPNMAHLQQAKEILNDICKRLTDNDFRCECFELYETLCKQFPDTCF